MKINSSTILMDSTSQKRTISKTTEQLTAWVGNRTNGQNQVTGGKKLDFVYKSAGQCPKGMGTKLSKK